MVSLSTRVGELCSDTRKLLPTTGAAHAAIGAVADRLAEPALRLAVAGRLNAGKSTLVNALAGADLAATDATECTTVVTWYQYGEHTSLHVRTRAGDEYELPGGGPPKLDRPAEEVADVTVTAPVPALRSRYRIVDTPGLDSVGRLDDLSAEALRQADALLYVMPHPGERDRDALAAFRAASRGARMSAYNAVGVLSRIDQLGGGPDDPWPGARRVAARYAGTLRTLLSDVVPVVGLVAAATAGTGLTQADAGSVAALADSCPPADRRRVLARRETLLAADLPVPVAERARVHGLLGTFGLREALRLADTGVRRADALGGGLRALCGFDTLLATVDHRFVRHADVLRSDAALAALERLTWTPAPPAERAALAALRSRIAVLRRDPRLLRAELAGMLSDAGSDRLPLDDEAVEQLLALVTGDDDAARVGLPAGSGPLAVRAAAERLIDRWRPREDALHRAVADCARTVRTALEALYAGGTPGP